MNSLGGLLIAESVLFFLSSFNKRFVPVLRKSFVAISLVLLITGSVISIYNHEKFVAHQKAVRQAEKKADTQWKEYEEKYKEALEYKNPLPLSNFSTDDLRGNPKLNGTPVSVTGIIDEISRFHVDYLTYITPDFAPDYGTILLDELNSSGEDCDVKLLHFHEGDRVMVVGKLEGIQPNNSDPDSAMESLADIKIYSISLAQ